MSELRENKYTASSLKILKGLEPVKKRPGMYIGSTDWRGTHHLVWETIDNAIDEALSGWGKKIYINIYKDGSISVQDEGRGIPCDYNEQEKMDGLDIVFCTLHGGGKFDSSSYKSSAGLHGVGSACVNALSEWLEVTVYKDGTEYHASYKNNGDKRSGTKVIGPTTKRGSIIRFKPDSRYLPEPEFKFDIIAERLNNSACQANGVHFYLYDERTKEKQEFFYQEGIKEYLQKKNEKKKGLHPIAMFSDYSSEIKAEFAFQFLEDQYEEKIYSFANSIFTVLEGSHVRGYRSGITKAFNEYATRNNIIKNGTKLDGNDIREGITGVVSVRIPEGKIQFEGQTKEKLGTPEAANVVENLVYNSVTRYLIENKQYASKIFTKILESQKARLAARSAKEEVRKQTPKDNEKTTLMLSGKLVPPQSKDYKKCELFIVEGDSAGGSAKKCRDKRYQGLLPLRGKPKNVSADAEDAFMKNEELSTLAYTIGTGTGKDFNIKNLRYDKVIIMTDADTDGAHIQNLLINFFYLKMKPLIEEGHVYVACPPLYRVMKMVGKKTTEIYAWNNFELEEAKKKIGSGYVINRYKGLGEMDAEQLWKTTMDPKYRKLLQVVITDDNKANEMINLFMGKDAGPRYQWINENIDFSDKSDFFIEEVKQHG
ncbi:MAG: type IIA DNA topoisomerase subunit B [Bacilli bacterium]|nr:type IIA DNA topoisomerase subunit B [Erysipelotrichaceae bacterium]MDD6249811.1 DNA topoisomerase IV subunit B [Bacillales bacterium]MDD7381940.1 DNA topoisomerase IV subunit B [Bacillales bacterium]MDY3890743.1 DNA topoisomerase IV subunit B [Bacilli bacterium]MDY6141158.1 DNA topoisomerase IV subunit B [Bacilli bacterium]